MKQIMNKIIAILLFSFIFGNCKETTIQKDHKIENNNLDNDQNIYKEVKFEIKQIEKTSNIEMYALYHYNFILNSDNEKAEIIIDNNIYPINLNFTYDTDSKNALSNIKVFENGRGNEIIFIPTFGSNDEFTYQLLLFKNNLLYENTISYSAFANPIEKNIVVNEKNEIFNINIGKINLKTNFTKNLSSLPKNDLLKIEKNNLPSDLKGSWAVICQNELTILDINKSQGFLSLYDFNAIYINLKVEKSSNNNEYILKYSSTSSQQNYYKDMLMIVDEDISKEKPIGKLIVQKGDKVELQWIGLYNIKKQKLEFVGNDFLLIKENGGKFPIILEKCE